MTKAYSYLRFSTEKQLQGASLERQDRLAVLYAEKHNLTLDKRSYRDLGISAFKGKNALEGELGTFLRAVEQGVIVSGSYLLIENLDRLSRDVVTEALVLFMSIINKGIVLVTVDNEAVFSKDTIKGDWTKLIIAIAEMARANSESTRKSVMVKNGIAKKREERKPNRKCPAWLKVNEAGTAYVEVTKHVKTVRKIFEMSAAGNGVYLIWKYLCDKDIEQLGNAELGWVVPAVARLLHNQAVIGRLVSKANNTVVEDYYPAIIDKNVFYSVQEKMKERTSVGKGRKGDQIANLFSGICVCGECGAKMRYVKHSVQNKAGRNYSYLHCTNAFYKKGCSAVPLNYSGIESNILHSLLLCVNIEFDDIHATLADPSIAIRAEIAEKNVQIETIMDLIEQQRDQQKSRNLLGRLTKREQELVELNQQLVNTSAPISIKEVSEQSIVAFHDYISLRGSNTVQEREARLRLQSTIRQYVKQITLPIKTTIEPNLNALSPDGPITMRSAYIEFNDPWNEQFKFSNDDPLEVPYEVPRPGAKVGDHASYGRLGPRT